LPKASEHQFMTEHQRAILCCAANATHAHAKTRLSAAQREALPASTVELPVERNLGLSVLRFFFGPIALVESPSERGRAVPFV
jgi:hypothetical protein